MKRSCLFFVFFVLVLTITSSSISRPQTNLRQQTKGPFGGKIPALIFGAGQDQNVNDVQILKFIKHNRAFLGWQELWKDLTPEFDLLDFVLLEEKSIVYRFEDSLSMDEQSPTNHFSLVSFCPDGSKESILLGK